MCEPLQDHFKAMANENDSSRESEREESGRESKRESQNTLYKGVLYKLLPFFF